MTVRKSSFIAKRLGFNDEFYFSRFFQAQQRTFAHGVPENPVIAVAFARFPEYITALHFN